MKLSFLEGNEAIALGAIKSNCTFFAGYPITPATSIFNTMMRLLPNDGGICLQGEDEIASIGFCLGASMAGHKVMTATSGPGISLCSEHISFAIGSEIPIVIVDVQRLGPSTGSATLGADGDIQFLQWGNSGGLPTIVLCPANVKDCYILTVLAFNLSEQYRCPVLIASNKEIAVNRESINLNKIHIPDIKNRKLYNEGFPYIPFKTRRKNDIPDFIPIGNKSGIRVRQTSSTHGIDGYITTSAEEINKFQERLKNKFRNLNKTSGINEFYFEREANTLIICYGVTSKSVKTVYEYRKKINKSISILVLKILWPIPIDEIKRASVHVDKVIVPEMNLGLYVLEVERILKDKEVISISHMNGKLITPDEIEKEL